MSSKKSKSKATKVKAEVLDVGTRPRGFYSPESQEKVKAARKMIVERYPSMSNGDLRETPPDDVTRYLLEVGAGRVLALYNFAADAKPAKPAKTAKPAKSRAKKSGK